MSLYQRKILKHTRLPKCEISIQWQGQYLGIVYVLIVMYNQVTFGTLESNQETLK